MERTITDICIDLEHMYADALTTYTFLHEQELKSKFADLLDELLENARDSYK